MNVTKQKLLYFTARIDIVHVGIDNQFEHHFRMIRTTARFLIKLPETVKIKIINHSIDYAHRIVRCYVFINKIHKLWVKTKPALAKVWALCIKKVVPEF